MRHSALIALAIIWGISCCLPARAYSQGRGQGRVGAGVELFRHDTNLKVESATDYDGSNMTAEQRAKDWDILGSAAGARLSYTFPRLVTLFGEGGIAQATVREKNVADPEQNVASHGLDDGTYLAGGVRVGEDFGSKGNLFWQMGGTVSAVSASLNQDVTTSWNYDETQFQLGGKVGTWVQQVGLYGGLRLVSSNAHLDETDRTRLPGQQTRTTELRRDGSVDLLLGAQTRGPDVTGFAEVGLMGTFSANAGVSVGF